MKLRFYRNMRGIVLLFGVSLCIATPVPSGTFRSECHERHFWLSIKSSFLGQMIRFDFEDQRGFHFLSDQEATGCGYTVLLNHHGDLVFRASFLACHVHKQADTDYQLRLWFINRQVDGRVAVYPFLLRCSLQWPWGTREMVCEENYMEVSIQRPILPGSSRGQEKGADELEWAVMFHRAGQPPEEARARSITEATALGYHISQAGSRLILRCPYSSFFSYTVKDKGVDLEVVNATILYPLQDTLLAIDATVACTMNEATVDGSYLLWPVPHALSPLTQGGFRDQGMRLGVGTLALGERDVQVGLREGLLEVRIPLGGQAEHIKSGVVEGEYGQSMSVHLFSMRQWEDHRWPLTQHRTFRLLRTPYVPQTIILTSNTVPSQGVFSVTLGPFPPDVALQKVTVGGEGDTLTRTQNQNQSQGDLRVSRLLHSNGSHSYQLNVPFSHPEVAQEYIGGGYKKYSIPLAFALTISPHGEVFYHHATIESNVQEQTASESPRLEGECTERGLLVLLHYGTQAELQWELFLGAHRLDWELVEMGGFRTEMEEDHFRVEIPLFSPGMSYEELTLRGLVAEVEVTVVNADTLQVEDRLVQRCTFPVRELLVCLPEGRMVAVVDTTHTIPPTQPNRTTLLDPSCVPLETDSARALFSFSLDSCGTTVTIEEGFLVYENQIRYAQDFLPPDDPLIHRDSSYSLTIQCRYPVNDTSSTLSVQHPVNSALDLSPPPLKRTRREANSTGEGKPRIVLRGQHKPAPGDVSVWLKWTLGSMLLLLLFSCVGIAAYWTSKCTQTLHL